MTHILFLGSTPSVPYVKNKGGVTVSVVTTGPHGDKPNSSASLTLANQKNSILIASDLKPDFKVAHYSLSVGILPAVPPASVPPHLPDKTNSTLREYSFFEAV